MTFDHLGLILHDPIGNAMQGHILNAPGNPVLTTLRLPVDDDPSGWVWQNQQPLDDLNPVGNPLAGIRQSCAR